MTIMTYGRNRVHAEGPTSILYYSDFDKLMAGLPKDVQIVAYCSCLRAAADSVASKPLWRGHENTADIFGWMNLGYPVMHDAFEVATE